MGLIRFTHQNNLVEGKTNHKLSLNTTINKENSLTTKFRRAPFGQMGCITAIQCANKQELYEQSHTNSKSQSGNEILNNLLNILQTTWETVVEKITGLLRHGKKLQLSCKKELQK